MFPSPVSAITLAAVPHCQCSRHQSVQSISLPFPTVSVPVTSQYNHSCCRSPLTVFPSPVSTITLAAVPHCQCSRHQSVQSLLLPFPIVSVPVTSECNHLRSRSPLSVFPSPVSAVTLAAVLHSQCSRHQSVQSLSLPFPTVSVPVTSQYNQSRCRSPLSVFPSPVSTITLAAVPHCQCSRHQ